MFQKASGEINVETIRYKIINRVRNVLRKNSLLLRVMAGNLGRSAIKNNGAARPSKMLSKH